MNFLFPNQEDWIYMELHRLNKASQIRLYLMEQQVRHLIPLTHSTRKSALVSLKLSNIWKAFLFQLTLSYFEFQLCIYECFLRWLMGRIYLDFQTNEWAPPSPTLIHKFMFEVIVNAS